MNISDLESSELGVDVLRSKLRADDEACTRDDDEECSNAFRGVSRRPNPFDLTENGMDL